MMSDPNQQTQPPESIDYDPFAGGALEQVVPTTEPQREIWLADQLGSDASLAFNESVSLRLRGALDVLALEAALQTLLDRHAALRSTIGPDGDIMCVQESQRVDLHYIDLSEPEDQAEAALAERKRLAVETPFDLRHGPLLRSELLKLGEQDHVLILTAHHIVCDGWSWWVMVRELAAGYARLRGLEAPELEPAEDFAVYALAEAERERHPGHALDERYWLARFAGGAPVLDLPTDRPRPPRRGFASQREDYVLDASLVTAIRRLGARRGASLFATLLASFATLLARLTGQNRVVIGIPAAGQSVDGHDALVGHCVNALPLLFELDLAQSAGKAIDDAQATLLDALDHQRYTFGTLLRKLKVERDPSRLPLISVMFNIDQALDQEAMAFPGLQLEFSSNPRSYENFELFVNAVQQEGELRLECQYNTGLFDATTIRHWLGYWRSMLEAMVADSDGAFGNLPLLNETERRQVLEKWNDSHADYGDSCVHDLFEQQAARRPDAIAVEFGERSLSYAQLNGQANRLANHLRDLGVLPDDRVAICAERGIEMVVAMLAVLKAGGAYVPLDPAYPVERLTHMLDDSAPKALLFESKLRPVVDAVAVPGMALLDLNAVDPPWRDALSNNPSRRAVGLDSSRLAYLIYTSGSTGKPKGVMVEHAGLLNYLGWAARHYAPKRSVVSSSFSFDATVTSLFVTLVNGGTVRMLPEKQEIDGLLEIMQDPRGCGLVKITPAHLDALGRRLQALGGTSHVETFVVGGESLPAATVRLWRQLQPDVRIVNEYGPTETVVGCCVYDVPPGLPQGSVVPIGRAIANMRLYILDTFGQPVPPGVAGEIHIGGAAVARGYLNRDDLTAERFLADPFAKEPGARMYKSGDLARWLADGTIEYIGRNDFQVKVRGYRVELGEIESALLSHADVAQASVITREDRPGDIRLVAYLVDAAGRQTDPLQLAAHLKRSLPDYMVPQHFVRLAAIPLTPNGKLDRAALPVPEVGSGSREPVAPRDPLEQAITDAMLQVLGAERLGIEDDFFALGGHSLLAAQLTTRLNRELGVQLSLRAVFDTPTAAGLAETVARLRRRGGGQRKPIQRRARQDRAPLSQAQERLRLIEQYNPGSVGYNGPSGHRLTGPLDVAKLKQAFQQLAQRQTVLRTTIGEEDGQPVQVIHDAIEITMELEDLSGLPRERREAELSARMRKLVEVPFSDLSKPPLFVTRLYKLGEQEHVLFFMPHHIIWDGWSFDLLYQDISELYAALIDARPPRLPELPISYGDYAVWHNEWLHGEEYAEQLAFWRERLGRRNADGGGPRPLPTDKPRPRIMSGNSKSMQIVLPQALGEQLHAVSRALDVTMFITLLGAYYALLAQMSGQEDMVIGTPVRGRNASETEHLMGYFTNLLPLRMQVPAQQPFRQFVRAVRAAALDSFANPDIRLEDLSRELTLRSESGGAVLYQALFSFQDIRQRITRWGNLTHERVEVFQPGATEDMGLWFVEEAKGLSGGLIYNSDIFNDDTVHVFVQRYQQLLHALARDPDASLQELTRFDDGHARLIGQIEPFLESAETNADAAASVTDDHPSPAGDPDMDPRVAYLLEVASSLLGTQAGPNDNFFDLGGNSMLAVQAADRVFKDTGVRIKLMRFALQNFAQIAEDLPARKRSAGPEANNTGGSSRGGWLKRLFGGGERR